MMVGTCSLSYLGGRGRRITSTREMENSLANMVKPWLYENTKIKKNTPQTLTAICRGRSIGMKDSDSEKYKELLPISLSQNIL